MIVPPSGGASCVSSRFHNTSVTSALHPKNPQNRRSSVVNAPMDEPQRFCISFSEPIKVINLWRRLLLSFSSPRIHYRDRWFSGGYLHQCNATPVETRLYLHWHGGVAIAAGAVGGTSPQNQNRSRMIDIWRLVSINLASSTCTDSTNSFMAHSHVTSLSVYWKVAYIDFEWRLHDYILIV